MTEREKLIHNEQTKLRANFYSTQGAACFFALIGTLPIAYALQRDLPRDLWPGLWLINALLVTTGCGLRLYSHFVLRGLR